MGRSIEDWVVEPALAELAAADPAAAQDARAALESLSWGQGLESLSLHSVADFLWYRLPTKWLLPLPGQRRIAAALGRLLELVDLPRYAALCTSPVTEEVLAAYDRHGVAVGLSAYRRALAATGVAPPDVPGLLTWGTVLGTEEAAAYWAVADRLDLALAAGEFVPGRRGWRQAAARVTAHYLTATAPRSAGGALLDRIHTERLDRWADSRAAPRAQLAAMLIDRLMVPITVPADAQRCVAPLRWLLELAAPGEGIALTATGALARAAVLDGVARFGWDTFGATPRSESQVPEAWTLRTLACEIGVVRRRGRRLLLTERGRWLRDNDTTALWRAVTAALIPAEAADGAAAEIALMLMLTEADHGYERRNHRVAEVMAGEGWHTGSGVPIESGQVGWLLGALTRRLDLLDLTVSRRLGEPQSLTPTGTAAAHTALRHRALGARDTP